MSGPIYGGEDPAADKQLKDPTAKAKGVYATYPAATPKYNASNHIVARDETQARLYIDIPDPAAYQQFLDAIPPEARRYANAMTRTTGSAGGKGYVDFFLTSTNEALREKVQVSEVLSDGFIAYYFGQAAPVWNYQMGLINSQQDEWYDAWNIVYENIIRGTRLAERKVAVTLAYDTRRVIGSIMQTQTGMNANNEMAINGAFSILVKELQVAISVTDSPDDVLARELEAQRLAEAEERLKQAQTVTMNKLSIARLKDKVGPSIREDVAGVRPGSNPSEVRAKTGVELLPHERIGVALGDFGRALSNVADNVSEVATGARDAGSGSVKFVERVARNAKNNVEVGISRTPLNEAGLVIGDIIF